MQTAARTRLWNPTQPTKMDQPTSGAPSSTRRSHAPSLGRNDVALEAGLCISRNDSVGIFRILGLCQPAANFEELFEAAFEPCNDERPRISTDQRVRPIIVASRVGNPQTSVCDPAAMPRLCIRYLCSSLCIWHIGSYMMFMRGES